MKQGMSRKLLTSAVLMVASAIPAFAAPSSIVSDVPTTDWSYNAVKQLAQEGLVSEDAGRFDGKRTVTRYQMAILVGNAMTKEDKATPAQKEIIDKLAAEYNGDLEKIGVIEPKVKPAAAKPAPAYKPNVNFFFDNRIEYTHTSDTGKGSSSWITGRNIKDSNQFMERIRVYMNSNVGDRWVWNARLVQAKWNTKAKSSDSPRFDRFWLTGKKMFGGTLEVGKMWLYTGKGGFFGNTGDTEGVYYTRQQGKKWTFRAGVADSDSLTASSQRISFLEGSYRPNDKMDIGAYALRQSYSDTLDDLDLRVINGGIELNKNLAFSFEYAKNMASYTNPYTGSHIGKESGYWVALQSKYKATNYMPALYTQMVNPFKAGDWGWALSYRHLPSGVGGKFNRGAFNWIPLTTDPNGNWQNTFDGINAWRADFLYVPWKNVQWTLTYDRVKYISNDHLNNSFQSTFNFFF